LADPGTPPQITPVPKELPIASQGKRFLHLIIDTIVIQVLATCGGFAMGLVYAASKIAANEPITAEDETTLEIVGYIVGFAVTLLYFVIMEAAFQRTIAKLLTGTKVVTATGERPSFGKIVGRSFARFIPFEAFSFLGGKFPVGWHDSLSGTRVVSTR
jgi:uncharacterized RDD family membrane protein YckC